MGAAAGPELLRLRAAALQAGLSLRTVQRLVARGQGPRIVVLPGLRGRWVRRTDLAAWLETLGEAGGRE